MNRRAKPTDEARKEGRPDQPPFLEQPFVGPEDLAGFDPARQLGAPGNFPFTRGMHRHMYRQRLWTMRQFAGFGSAADTNARFKYLLEKGQTGLSTAFDLPTLMGSLPPVHLQLDTAGRT